MVTTYLQGGLGNYMFQIAVAQVLGKEINSDTIFNESKATTIHRPLSVYKDNILRKIKLTNNDVEPPNIYEENGFEYKEIPKKDNVLLSGYFQSEKYFLKHENYIRELFEPRKEDVKYIIEKYGNLHNTCSIHVRRGDYVKQTQHHPVCSLQYYKEAINKIPKETNFLIFSDDIEWCKKNFQENKFTFIEKELDYIDMYIMSMCENNIIANSTFSWWGAWLNNNKNKIVVAPKFWFGVAKQNLNTKDIIPSKWIKI